MLTDQQKKFLETYTEFGHDGAAASVAGVMIHEVDEWVNEDEEEGPIHEEFLQAYKHAKAVFAGSLIREAIQRGRDGQEEPLIHKGQVQFLHDPSTGELVLDDNLMPIPATVRKKHNDLLKIALRAHVDEFNPRHKVESVQHVIEEEPEPEPIVEVINEETGEVEIEDPNLIKIVFLSPEEYKQARDPKIKVVTGESDG